MIVYHQPQRVADWVAAQRGEEAPVVSHALGYEHDGILRAGVYLDCMTENNIFAHIASNAPMFPRSLLLAVGAYVYDTLGIDRMTFAVPANMAELHEFVAAMGAEKEATLSKAAGIHDLDLYVLWRDSPYVRRMLYRED